MFDFIWIYNFETTHHNNNQKIKFQSQPQAIQADKMLHTLQIVGTEQTYTKK